MTAAGRGAAAPGGPPPAAPPVRRGEGSETVL